MTLLKQSIDSDKDYLKIALANSITLNANGTPDADSTFPNDPDGPLYANSTTVNHGLASIPMVRAFWDPNKNGRWYSAGTLFDFPAYLKFFATTTTVKFMMGANTTQTSIPVYYRIYDFNNFSTDSDSLVDKIFKADSTSQSVGAASDIFTPGTGTITIPHGQGEVPLWTMQFSESASGPWQAENLNITGAPDTSTGPPGGPYSYYRFMRAYGSADDTNFYVHMVNGHYVAKTFYVRFSLDYKV